MGVTINFDASTVAPATAQEAIPSNWYDMAIVESEMKPTKDNANTGNMFLQLILEVLNGPYKGARQFERLNLQNSNPTAVEIAYKTLSAICHATGVIQCADTGQLHNRPLQGKVVLKPAGADGTGVFREASNEIKGYRSVQAGQQVASNQSVGGQNMGFVPPATQQVVAAPVQQWAPPAQAAVPAPVQQAAPVQQQAPAAVQQTAAAAPPWAAANPAPNAAAVPDAAAPPWAQQQAPAQAAPVQQQAAPAQAAPGQAAPPPWAK